MTAEFYPMPSFVSLIVRDLEASARFYQQALGFEHIFSMPGPGGKPALVHLHWVKYADLLIALPRDGRDLPEPRGTGVSIHFNLFDRFEGNIESLAEQARAQGAQVVGPLEQPWNVCELTVIDPDGYRLVFSVPVDTGLAFDQMLERVTRRE